ncbi:hypothetical protein KJ652_03590 [Patescibacteria group bacterium]|nr:hypothetical protein [Patescibacteria group bacterium]
MARLGISMGWVQGNKLILSADDCASFVKKFGLEAIEVNLSNSEQERTDALLEGKSFADRFKFNSIHIDSRIKVSEDGVVPHLDDIMALIKLHNPDRIVSHPSDTDEKAYQIFSDRIGTPIAIENMSVAESSFEDFESLNSLSEKYGMQIVLDLQHACEVGFEKQDPSFAVSIAEKIINSGNLSHLHISGEIRKNGGQVYPHVPVCMATNKDEISDLLSGILHKLVFDTVIICEGDPFFGFGDISESNADDAIKYAEETYWKECDYLRGIVS